MGKWYEDWKKILSENKTGEVNLEKIRNLLVAKTYQDAAILDELKETNNEVKKIVQGQEKPKKDSLVYIRDNYRRKF